MGKGQVESEAGKKRRVKKGRQGARMRQNERRRRERKRRIEKVIAIDKKLLSGTLRGARCSFCSNCRVMNLHWCGLGDDKRRANVRGLLRERAPLSTEWHMKATSRWKLWWAAESIRGLKHSFHAAAELFSRCSKVLRVFKRVCAVGSAVIFKDQTNQ